MSRAEQSLRLSSAGATGCARSHTWDAITAYGCYVVLPAFSTIEDYSQRPVAGL